MTQPTKYATYVRRDRHQGDRWYLKGFVETTAEADALIDAALAKGVYKLGQYFPVATSITPPKEATGLQMLQMLDPEWFGAYVPA